MLNNKTRLHTRSRFSYNIVEKKNNEGVADMKKLKALLINGSPRAKGCTYTALTELKNTLEQEGRLSLSM